MPDPQRAPRSFSRRRFMTGTVAAGGAGLALGDILRLQADAAERGSAVPDTAVIQFWLGGGPSQFETFDPKPDAPAEIRGPYGAIPSKLPGALVCEMLPLTAGVLDRATIVRSFTHGTNDHFVGTRWCMNGHAEVDDRADYPSSGAVVSRFRNGTSDMPTYALLCDEPTRHHHMFKVLGPGYLGVGHSPFTVLQSVYEADFQTDRLRTATANLELANDITLDRVDDRKTLLRGLDRLPRALDSGRMMEGLDRFTRLALEMVSNEKARRAFDLSTESAATHAMYGKHRWGQMALLARRLVEAGVTFVTLNTAPDCLRWDWHRNVVNEQRPAEGPDGPNRGMSISGPALDRALSALIADLHERGLSRRVLLIVWGEFGRTPRLNHNGGRDHWGSLGNVLLAGGRIPSGELIGASAPHGDIPVERPVSPTDLLATLYQHLGIDLQAQTINTLGRPIPLLPDGKPLFEAS